MSDGAGEREPFVKSFSHLDHCMKQKISNFNKSFRKTFQVDPDYVVCVPGRVNLIGDHIDYHGFSVLPMALEKGIVLGFHSREAGSSPNIRLKNTDGQFEEWTGEHSLSYGSDLDKSHQWFNYILCGYHGLLSSVVLGISPQEIVASAAKVVQSESHLQQDTTLMRQIRSIDILVSSDLPIASGLSSSSALLCASSVAFGLLLRESLKGTNIAIEKYLSPQTLAEICPFFEHLIGTRGGGMDQAVVMTAQKGYAKFVEFNPTLRCSNVLLPEDAVWLVSHCGSSYAKAATSGFNTRVLETKLGAAIIAKHYGLTSIKLDKTITISSIKHLLFQDMAANLIVEQLKRELFGMKDKLTVRDVCHSLDTTQNELINNFSIGDNSILSNPLGELKIPVRCFHVLEETERVERFKFCCQMEPTDLKLLGKLMTESHESLRSNYDCSHPDLDRLVAVANEAGALGSRLSGAGWGGCIVTLVEPSKLQRVTDELERVSKFTFATKPQSGCLAIDMSECLCN